MKFSEVLKDPNAFGKLAMMGEDLQDKNKAMEVVKELPGVQMENKEEISITVK